MDSIHATNSAPDAQEGWTTDESDWTAPDGVVANQSGGRTAW
jgi:hypothetical protein